ncbi:acyltransferase family protein [Deminuibacter soli]|uniref:Acyltransferase n=1 Tax=Deminuibacter soli TaxID=2291815 RepID=A0A3E1NJZ1_9BACT|nr:acyltransferase family protein [Deminuibacter soli]RFM28255.1 acyltransferase [Deminuibacter soli]
MQTKTASRQTWLDWLRIASIAGVVFFHSCMPFATGETWHLRNEETSDLMLEFVIFMHLIRMPLLFFISGTVSYYMMRNRSAASFIGLRVRRLLLPLLFGILVIVPPQIYLERAANGYTGSFWDFYPSIFKFQPYPHGNFSWHHLWFIAYLFLYDLLLAPVFAWLMRPENKLVKSLAALAHNKRIYLLMIPSSLWFAWRSPYFPQTADIVHDGCYFVYWMLFLVAGFLCIIQPALMESLQRNRRFSLSMGIITFVAVSCFRWNHWAPWNHTSPFMGEAIHYLLLALKPVITFTWVFALLGYGKQYLNKPGKLLPYLNNAVYPFFILHQTVIVLIAWYVLPMHESIMMKYWFIVAVTFMASISIYHLFIRPFAITRLLFGMKPDAAAKPAQQQQPATAPQAVLANLHAEHTHAIIS